MFITYLNNSTEPLGRFKTTLDYSGNNLLCSPHTGDQLAEQWPYPCEWSASAGKFILPAPLHQSDYLRLVPTNYWALMYSDEHYFEKFELPLYYGPEGLLLHHKNQDEQRLVSRLIGWFDGLPQDVASRKPVWVGLAQFTCIVINTTDSLALISR